MKTIIADTFWESADRLFNPNWIQRLKNRWYKIKCFLWKRYSTVKPRNLPHTWVDRSDLLPHCMFEILQKFYDEEVVDGWVEWYGEYGHRIDVHGKEVYVVEEIIALLWWWNNVYLRWDEMSDKLFDKCDGSSSLKVTENGVEFKPSEHNVKIYRKMNNAEERLNEELEEMMIRLCRIRRSLWT